MILYKVIISKIESNDILLDVSSNIWSQYSSNNWVEMGPINITNEIPSTNLMHSDLFIDLTTNTILFYNSNLIRPREIIGWEEINKDQVKFYPTVYADSSRNHLFRYDFTLEPSGNEIGWELNNTSIDTHNNIYVDEVKNSNYYIDLIILLHYGKL